MATFVLVDTTDSRRARFARGVRLDAAAGARHTIQPVSGLTAAEDALSRVPAPVAVIDPYAAAGLDIQCVSELRRTFPGAGMIAYAALNERPAQDLFDLARMGVDSALSLGVDDDARGVRRAIAGALKRHDLSAVLAALAGMVSQRGYQLVWETLLLSERPLTVPELAAALGLHHRSLERFTRAEKLPPPARLINWCRITHAARLLSDPGRSVESVGAALGFPDGPTLRKLIKRETGLRPRELMQNGTLQALVAAFAGAVRRARELGDGALVAS